MEIKLTIVGDEGVGKTCLLIAHAKDIFPEGYVPKTFEQHPVDMTVDGKQVRLFPWDTPGEEEISSGKGRHLAYSHTDVALVCFAVDSPDSYQSVIDKWYPELTQHCPKAPIILVGTKLDLRDSQEVVEKLKKSDKEPCSSSDGLKLKSMNDNVAAYMECSSLTREGVKEIFEEAVRAALQNNDSSEREHSGCILT